MLLAQVNLLASDPPAAEDDSGTRDLPGYDSDTSASGDIAEVVRDRLTVGDESDDWNRWHDLQDLQPLVHELTTLRVRPTTAQVALLPVQGHVFAALNVRR